MAPTSSTEIAAQLHEQGQRSITGKPYTASIIQWIRFRYGFHRLKKPDELTVHQVAKHFGVSDHVVYYWIQHALVQARKLGSGSPYWITLNKIDEQKLQERVRTSSRIHAGSSTQLEEGAL